MTRQEIKMIESQALNVLRIMPESIDAKDKLRLIQEIWRLRTMLTRDGYLIGEDE